MRLAWGLVLAVLLGLGGAARAQDPSSLSAAERTERSRAHYERGRAHFNLGEYPAAMREFEEGYRWKPVPTFLFNIAQSARRAGQPDKALEMYRRYMVIGPKASDRHVVEQQIAELEQEIAARPPPVPPEPEKPAPPVEPPPKVEPPTPKVEPPPAPVAAKPVREVRKWYRDWLAPVLLAAGALVMIASGADFALKDAERSRAGDSYEAHQRALDAAPFMTVDAALMGAGALLAAGGAIRWTVVGVERRF